MLSVRQNLGLLVSSGAPAPTAGSVRAWGSTLGGVAAPARSALGVDASGNLVYAGSMSALPADLAAALVAGGVRTAMELDINPYWVQADAAAVPGGPLVAEVARQNRAAGQYLWGWTRDFVTVLARS